MIVSKHHKTSEQLELEEKQILAAQASPQKFGCCMKNILKRSLALFIIEWMIWKMPEM